MGFFGCMKPLSSGLRYAVLMMTEHGILLLMTLVNGKCGWINEC